MNIDRAIDLLRIEKECVMRAEYCDRKCEECVLVQDANELKEMYEFVVDILEHYV